MNYAFHNPVMKDRDTWKRLQSVSILGADKPVPESLCKVHEINNYFITSISTSVVCHEQIAFCSNNRTFVFLQRNMDFLCRDDHPDLISVKCAHDITCYFKSNVVLSFTSKNGVTKMYTNGEIPH